MQERESPNEALKQYSRSWWSKFSQDYVDPGDTPHKGVPRGMSDEEFLAYLERIDANFLADAYFAQDHGQPLFSGLMPVSWLAGKRVLEVGCGLGAHTEMLCRASAHVTAIDFSRMSVEVTRRRLALKRLTAKVLEADAESLPFGDASFDYVWSWGVIHHSPDTVACAREMVRVLRPGGRIAIMLYHRNSLYNWLNVVLRYGIVRGQLLRMSVQDLHNRYTDGKKAEGAPLCKYYTRRAIREQLFPSLAFTRQRCFEQKHAVTFFVPARWRRSWQRIIPDRLYSLLWTRVGFLVFSEGNKRDGKR